MTASRRAGGELGAHGALSLRVHDVGGEAGIGQEDGGRPAQDLLDAVDGRLVGADDVRSDPQASIVEPEGEAAALVRERGPQEFYVAA